MRENANKREGMLVGKLNRQRDRAPAGIIKDDGWVKDGDSIRALGAPMGNKLNEVDWWWKKYAEVKRRIAAWKSIGYMSLTGRNMLLQAIMYGSIRFWLFFMALPNVILKELQQDAYELLWAENPDPCAGGWSLAPLEPALERVCLSA